MTAVTADVVPAAAAPASRRIVNAARIHASNPWPSLVLPWIIYAAIFGMTLAIQYLVTSQVGRENLEPDAFAFNGGGFWVLFYMTVMMVQAMNLTFRFAMGISLTRREYYLGTMLYFGGIALYYATGLTLLAAIERATGGWGMASRFFAPEPLVSEPLWVVWAVWVMLFALFLSVGAAVATIYVRWGSNGMIAFFLALALAVVLLLWSLIGKPAGERFVAWAAEASILEGMLATVPLSALWLVAGYLNLRRASAR